MKKKNLKTHKKNNLQELILGYKTFLKRYLELTKIMLTQDLESIHTNVIKREKLLEIVSVIQKKINNKYTNTIISDSENLLEIINELDQQLIKHLHCEKKKLSDELYLLLKSKTAHKGYVLSNLRP